MKNNFGLATLKRNFGLTTLKIQMLEREAKREKNLETRAKELRPAAKKAEAQVSP